MAFGERWQAIDDSDSLDVIDDDTVDRRTISGRIFGTLPAETYWVIAEGTTWTIEPGTTLRFEPATKLSVAGTLLAEGDNGNEIVFTSDSQQPGAGDWTGIHIINTGGPREASSASAGPSVTGNVIHHNGTGVSVYVSSGGKYGWARAGGTYNNNLIIDNNTDGMRFTRIPGPNKAYLSPRVVNNTIARNGDAGIEHDTYQASPLIRNNIVVSNTIGVSAISSFSPEAEEVGFNDVWNNTDADWINYPADFGDPTVADHDGIPSEENDDAYDATYVVGGLLPDLVEYADPIEFDPDPRLSTRVFRLIALMRTWETYRGSTGASSLLINAPKSLVLELWRP
ncbi:MAG: right-handed parallel beta-helix repeat-containing protein, partial [Thermoguttaceae bacterium]